MVSPANTVKAQNFYQIQDAVSSNVLIDENHEFYIDFSKYRTAFQEKYIYNFLSIDENKSYDEERCKTSTQSKKIFLSGYRGIGKTSELLKLKNTIQKTQCYFTVFIDASDGLDMNNIETVDVLILMLETLLEALEKEGATIEKGVLSSFYAWYGERIEEVNKVKGSNIELNAGAKASVGILSFLKLSTEIKSQLKGSSETKVVIRRVFNKSITEFITKFNEFVLSTKEKLQSSNKYKDILFIIDGFEKIGTLKDRKKILIDDANRFISIKSHMLVTLPIELLNQRAELPKDSITLDLPLIHLEGDGAYAMMEEFILKRVEVALFDDNKTIRTIIKYGAGHPRQTLQIISRAQMFSEVQSIDATSVDSALKAIGKELAVLNVDEMNILHKISQNGMINAASHVYLGLKKKNIILNYNDEEADIINPILERYTLYNRRLEALNA